MSKPNDRRDHKRNQETKKIILAKKENKSSSKQNEASSSLPKVILKSKEKPKSEVFAGTSVSTDHSLSSRSQDSSVKESRKVIEIQPKVVKVMTAPVDIITANQTIISQSSDYLSDTNTDYFVIGVIGPQNTGKSTIMNLLTTMNGSSNTEYSIINSKNPLFRVRCLKNCTTPSAITETIQMYVTTDRIILLDSPPLFCNKFKKNCTQTELDDLKTISLLLSICHLVLVVVDNYFNTNLIRDLQCAEMMIFNNEKRVLEDSLANIMFVKNKTKDVEPTENVLINKYYKQLFKNSKLKIHFGNNLDINDKSQINYFNIPYINPHDAGYKNYEDIDVNAVVMEFRKRVFMSSRYNTIKKQGLMTEKQWSQLVVTVWDSHKNNYFFRKYETLSNQSNAYMHHFNDRD